MIFDSWIFITNKKGTKRFYSWMNIHVFYQNPQGELFKVWMVFRFVDRDIWQLNLYHKHKRDTKVLFMKNIHMFFLKSTRWNLQIMNGLWISWQWSLTDESLSHTHRGHRFYSLMIFMCFIKIHKVNSSKYEPSLDLLTVIFDRQI